MSRTPCVKSLGTDFAVERNTLLVSCGTNDDRADAMARLASSTSIRSDSRPRLVWSAISTARSIVNCSAGPVGVVCVGSAGNDGMEDAGVTGAWAAADGGPARPKTATRTTAAGMNGGVRISLLIVQGIDGIEPRSARSRIETKDDTDGDRNRAGHDHGGHGHDGGPAGQVRDELRQHDADDDAGQATADGDQRGFDKELANDVLPRGADRAAHAYFAGALHHAGEHDVHDADAAHEERNRGDGDHHEQEQPARLLLLREELGRHDDREVARVPVVQVEEAADERTGVADLI